MQTIIRLAIGLSLAYMVTGCTKDLLDTVPNDRLSSEIFWKTEADAKLASNAVYTYLDGAAAYFSWDGLSDIAHVNSNTSFESLIARGQYDATFARVLEEWTNAYAGIQAANSYLANVDQVKTSNTTLITTLKAEVRSLRAYYYLRLASLYGSVPLITTPISLEESRKVTRAGADEVWNFIFTELQETAAALPVTQAEKGRFTKGAALALQARALLYAGKYAEAATAAKQVIDLNVYSLYPSYKNLFTYAAENNAEVILDKQFIKNAYANNVFKLIGPWSQQNSSSAYVPTKALTDAYSMSNGQAITEAGSGYNPQQPYENRDPRLKYSIFTPGDKLPDGTTYNSRPGSGTADAPDFSWFSTQTGLNIKKYLNSEDYPDPANGGINLILIRYAEVLLTYAEAKVESNSIDQSVVDAINLIRQRPDVNLPPIAGIPSQAALRELIRQERKVELAFEGQRFFDIRRWKIAENVLPGKVYGLSYVENGVVKTIEVTAYTRVFNKARDYNWPIPNRERELNPSLTQNDNW